MNSIHLSACRRSFPALALTALALAGAPAGSANGQVLPTGSTAASGSGWTAGGLCWTNTLNISTGAGATILGREHHPVPDVAWRVVRDPFTQTHEPRPARLIAKDAFWPNAIAGSQWIGSTDTAYEWGNGSDPFFIFCMKFCARAPLPLWLDMTVQCGHQVDFFLNPPISNPEPLATFGIPGFVSATHVGTHPGGSGATPLSRWLFNVQTGENLLYARVTRAGGNGPLGLNLRGTVRSVPGELSLLQPDCCSGSVIVGRTFHDVQCNFSNVDNRGFRQAGHPVVAQRIAPASPAVFEVTISDVRGDWAFLDLPRGDYIIGQPLFLPWFQSVPLIPTQYFVSLNSLGPQGVTLTNLSDANIVAGLGPNDQGFGNCFSSCFTISQPIPNSDASRVPELECETVPGVIPGVFNTEPVLKNVTLTNGIPASPSCSCTINRIRVDVVYGPPGLTVVNPLVNLSAPIPPGTMTTLPKIRLNALPSHVGKPVCLRISLIIVSGGVEFTCEQLDVCSWIPCATIIGGGE
ncbi:MAG TPA: hypothetical protein PKC43_05055 [Phycisphaerales bacterium]|nr:hypothetical protein [Phycisphaerales bacterium]HMP36798.1 hypothetical protein [Phycisphaerales bacterium]